MHDRLGPDVPHQVSTKDKRISKGLVLGGAFLVFGVFLPVITLCIELVTHWSAMDYFDPIPTWWHVLLVALVPVTNGLIWLRTRAKSRVPDRLLTFLAGISLVVAAAYALVYLPLALFAVVAVLMAGIGLLPLAPLMALINNLRGLIVLSRTVPNHWIGRGIIAGILAIGTPAAWDFNSARLLDRAIDGSDEQRAGAIQDLRTFGREGYLLERCYGGRTFGGNFFGKMRTQPHRIEAARTIYFRVTGQAFETRPVPAGLSVGARARWSFNFDPALGGNRVANKVDGLTLKSSQFTTRVDGVGLTNYTEWTAVFKNTAFTSSEARALIEVPPGGVVSRVTLWIDGEPREAAFGGRSQVRAAYQEVAVQQRRDPILVTTAGSDRVLMQCFPVLPNGQEMKVRVGITSPLRIADQQTVGVSIPRLIETNFEPGWGLSHEWEMIADSRFNSEKSTVRKSFRDRELSAAREVRLFLKDVASESYAEDPVDPNYAIRQSFRSTLQDLPKRVIYVIDGSQAMKMYRGQLGEIFHMSKVKPDAALYCGDTLETWDGKTPIGLWIAQREYDGGQDNVPALEAAWDLASQEANSAIVWIHGPQPVELKGTDGLLNRVERASHRPVIYDLAMEPAPNRVAEALGDSVSWRRLGEMSSPLKNVMNVLGTVTGAVEAISTHRERVPLAEIGSLLPRTDRHLVRLWGREEVDRLRKVSPEFAMKLAVQLQLVTPASGAVVLEQKEQYDRHGLTPAEPGTVPMIPEPGSVLLLASAAGCLALKRKRARAAGVNATRP